MGDLKPHMAASHVLAIEAVLSTRSKVNVLEWGAGYSTIYFTDWLHQQGIDYHWTAIELSSIWYKKVCDEVLHRPVLMRLFDYGPITYNVFESRWDCPSDDDSGLYQTLLKRLPLEDYVNYPLDVKRTYDIILVDGRKRAKCIAVAKQCLNPNGVIILHDAEREYYHAACEGLHIQKVEQNGSQLWIMQP